MSGTGTVRGEPARHDSLFQRAGGESGVRDIVTVFVDRMVCDLMIGFFFAGVDKARLVEREFAFTARFLGHDCAYEGRPLRAAHAAHRIMGGHFARRKQILREVLEARQVPKDVAEAWLNHVESLRDQVTADGPGECA
ncbi:MAG: group 1 truncated hemoglobin [Myxococcales bacterium]|nr:group 1 truncated hemoglobin [Myxococcales bacterium]